MGRPCCCERIGSSMLDPYVGHIRHQKSDIGHPKSGIRNPTSDIRNPFLAAPLFRAAAANALYQRAAARNRRTPKSYTAAPISPPSIGPTMGTQNALDPSVRPLFLNPATAVNRRGPKSRAGLIA